MDPAPRLRASDDDRSQTVASLQEALSRGQLTLGEFDERAKLAYGARFRDELDALVTDLGPSPSPGPAAPVAASGPRRPAAREQVTGEAGGTSWSAGILGAASYEGLWHIADNHTTVSLMGYTELDLSSARLPAQETGITALSLMGSTVISVPEDFRIISDGVGIMGSFSVSDDEGVSLALSDLPPDAPVIRVRGVAFMAAVEVLRVPRT